MKVLTDKQQKWGAVILVILIPFVFVHLFSTSPIPRLISLLWVSIVFPIGLFYLIFFTAQPVRLRNYSNPIIEKRLEIAAKIFGCLLLLTCVWGLTLPMFIGSYRVFLQKESFLVIEDSVASQSTTVLATGLYWNIKLSKDRQVSYIYLFPTVFRFGENKFKFTILPGTNFILNAEGAVMGSATRSMGSDPIK